MITNWILRAGLFVLAANFVGVFITLWLIVFGIVELQQINQIAGLATAGFLAFASCLFACSDHKNIKAAVDL